MQLNRYITLDGHKYVISQGTYLRKWQRSFSSQLAGNIIRLNFVDRGPGLRNYTFQIICRTWEQNSQPYLDGITDTWDVQLANLQASYGKIATAISFYDPFGNPAGPDANAWGVYFTNLNEQIPQYSTNQQVTVLCDCEIVEATEIIA